MTLAPSLSASRPIPSSLSFALALAAGVAAANIYYVQPVVGLLAEGYGIAAASAGLFVTMTQLGYVLGLVLVVPLADIVENRRLIAGLLALLVAALALVTFASSATLFVLASILVGLGTSVVQIIVPYAGHLAPDATRGRTVGNVVSGLLFGVMLARPASSFAAHITHDPRAIFALSALVCGVLALVFYMILPERRPLGLPYFRAIRSLVPLIMKTEVLQRRGAYQAALFAAFSLFWTTVPLLLTSPRFGFSQAEVGLFALAGAAGALVSPHAGRWADSGKTALVTTLALVGASVSFVIAMAGGFLASWPLILIAALLLDVAAAANLVTGQRAIFAVGAEVRGRLNGLYLALFFFGGSFGSFISGYVLAYAGWTGVSLAGIVLPLLAMAYFLTEKKDAA